MNDLPVLWRPKVTLVHLHEEPNLINKVFNRNTVVIGITSDILDEIRVEAAEGPTRSRRTSVMSDSDYQANDAVESAFKRALKKAAPNMEMVEEEQSESSFAGSHRSEVKTIIIFQEIPPKFSNRNNHQCNRRTQHQPCQLFLECPVFQRPQKPPPIFLVRITYYVSKIDQTYGKLNFFRNDNVINSINCFWKISCYRYHNSFWKINQYNFNNIWCIHNSVRFPPT